MTGAEYDGAVKALREQAERLVAETRDKLAKDAAALVGALEAKVEVLERHARTSDLVASAAFFTAVPAVVNDNNDTEPNEVGCIGRGGHSLGAYSRQNTSSANLRIPHGHYTLVVALIPRSKP